MKPRLLPLLVALSMPALGNEAEPSALNFTHYVAPTVPPAVAHDARGGFAVIAFTVDAEGSILDAVALSASDHRFAEALVQTVRQWQLTPTAGNALPRRELVEFVFQDNGYVRTVTHAESVRAAFSQAVSAVVQTVRRDQLEAAPARTQPTVDAVRNLVQGVPYDSHATLSYVIDQQGRVRVPVVVTSDNPKAAIAALEYASTWSFEPVHHKGAVVLVEDRQVLTFRSNN